MKVYFTLGLFCILFSTAYATSIYKWKDEHGVIHYGDKNNTPQNGKEITVKSSQRVEPQAQLNNSQNSLGENSQTTRSVKEKANESTLKTCLSMARVMVNKGISSPEVIRADSKALLGLCPDTAYNCVTYELRPSDNKCEAYHMEPGGNITTNKTYR